MSASRPKPMTGPYTDGLRRKVTNLIFTPQVFLMSIYSFNIFKADLNPFRK